VHVAAEAAVQSNSVDKCNDASDVGRCETIFYKDMAVKSGDSTYCNNITDTEQQDICKQVVSSLTATSTAAEEGTE
ncbi:hypothetical protein HZA99_06810, partial [Candidatus Woesearchaeota archaeon]|nr:hypothetical protein [Candidatus Woesearchaeota archaeon]